ncbi:MAG: baseplate J/gp47 family protein [Clostridia bacterium]
MYEDYTYDMILERMLARVPDTIDKREGSIIMNALAPAAMEIYMAYFELDRIIDESFADTQSREYLIRRAAERGIVPIEATPSVWTAEIVGSAEVGDKFTIDGVSFTLIEQTDINEYSLQCDETGTVGNEVSGTLVPTSKTYTSAELLEIKTMGAEEEDTEVFRTRYFDSLDSLAFGGNVSDYKEKALSIQGVGGVKVVPAWDGAGTVKVIIVGSDSSVPSDDFVEEVQDTFDPVYGQGYGLAPIGHICTVEGVKTKTVDISVTIECDEVEDVLESIKTVIDEYFDKLISSWSGGDNIIVRISQIESAILDIVGIYDITTTKINTLQSNLTLDYETIPIRGEVNAQLT